MSRESRTRIELLSLRNLAIGRVVALELKRATRREMENRMRVDNKFLQKRFRHDKNIQKIALVMLYLAEGSKTDRRSVMFGNSSPGVIRLFLNLLRAAFPVDEKKFRVTVQCRADQNVPSLERFWSDLTRIPRRQFYRAQIDRRSINKPTRKVEYKGVCRIDYFSSAIDFELKHIAEELQEM